MGNCLSTKREEQLDVGDTLNKHTANGQARRSLDMYRVGGGLTVGQREALVQEGKRDAALASLMNRIVDTGAVSSASVHTQQGRKGRNQDTMIAWEEFCQHSDTTFAAVFDGHGPYGHLAAKRVRDSMPTRLADSYTEAAEDGKSKDAGIDGDRLGFWTKLFWKAYKEMDSELRTHPVIDTWCSGTTAIAAVKEQENLLIANLGDSRAVLATEAEDAGLEAVQLSVDMKPNVPAEVERITSQKGRVFALPDEPETSRVWLPHEDSPGLAMSRAFGDMCLKDFGVISEPEVTLHKLGPKDKFVVLASDGVWDVMSNQEVVDTVAAVPNRRVSAEKLIEVAVGQWREKFPRMKVDDCAVVVLYVDGLGTDGPPLASKVSTGAPAGAPVKHSNTEEGYPSSDKASVDETPGSTSEIYDESEMLTRNDSVMDLASLGRAADDAAPDYESVDATATRANSVIGLPRKL